MSLVINSNIMSLNAQRNLTSSLNEQDQAMERLSSGKRINSAADDAAGLSIASRMTSQVSGLNQAVRNANDGQSLIQTAEGALDESTNILQRMRELSIQSASGTYDSGNRATMNAEVNQLIAELDRISETTSFNGQNVLDGSIGTISLQVGSEANQTIEMEIGAMDSKSLGLGSTSADVMGASITKASIALENNTVLINGQSIMAIGESYTGSSDNLGDLVDSINTNVSGVSASSYAELTATTSGDGILVEGTDTLTVTLTKLDGTTAAISVTDTDSLESLVDKLNEEGGGLLSASITDDNELSISAENVASVGITDAGGAAGTIAATVQASITLSSDSGDDITVERGSAGTTADLTALGFRESNVSGVIEGVASDGGTTTLASGDVTINGVTVGAGETGDLQDTVAAINAVSDESGVTANAFTSVEIDTSDTAGSGLAIADFSLNGVIIDTTSDATIADVAASINAKTSSTGITAVLDGQQLRFEGDVSSITFGDDTGAADTGAAFQAVLDLNTAPADTLGGVKLTSDSGSPISVDVTADGALATGLLDANSTSSGTFGSSLSSLDISTAAGAQKAIGIIDNALETINSTRGDMGAVANRLDFTVSNLSNVSENVSAARSRIEDADFAEESANLSRAQVLQQAGTAMLAQANAAPQQVLSLLQ
ncbi:flagellin [Amphritea sp. 2_MG-2023]|uniref:flagellin N-terminal helical domain-containing protein n=1 Tax=Amphritea TaxID=515417 RepID=UPI001C07A456|nr:MULTISPECIES: flagellin [Amphritea]MBU2964837.1 flagellin [Amphritea atlantica]MDO6419588.1 flagellin [Amphritea sp. 2_MG-2023]